MKKLFSLISIMTLALVLVACGATTTVDTNVTTQAAPIVLNWNIGADPDTLDPALNAATDGGDVINNTFEGLVRDVAGVISPGIAESWDVSEDGLTYTFHLRHSLWSDGSDLTANDFVWSWQRAIDPNTASDYSYIWEYTNVENAYDILYNGADPSTLGVEATDDYTLVVTLTVPTPYFVGLMSFFHFMPTKQSAVEAEGGESGLWAKDPDLVVCNGPFMLSDYKSGDGLTLVKNPNYWNADEVYLSQINGKFIQEASTAYVGYNSGTLDVIPSVPTAMTADLIALDPNFHVFALPGTYYYMFNLDPTSESYDPIFANVKLRTAMTYAINRTAITETLSAGQIPATAFVPPGFLDADGNDFAATAGDYGIATDDSNFDQAVTLFAEAASELGMTVAELQADLSDKVLLYNTSEGHQLIAQMVVESWNQVLGFEMSLQNQDWAVFQNTRTEGDFDIARGGWITDYMDPMGLLSLFTSSSGLNDGSYSSTVYDEAIAAANSATDNGYRFDQLYAAQEQLMEDLPIIPVYYYADTLLIREYVQDWGRSSLGSLDFTHAKIVDVE